MKKLSLLLFVSLLFFVNIQCTKTESVEEIPSSGSVPTFTLNNGMKIPAVGLGTWSLHGDTCYKAVYGALKCGCRLIDSAHRYDNEQEVGRAIRQAIADGICKREDVTVITKLYPGEQYANPEAAIQLALDSLNIGYIDIMLLHHPGENDVKAYKAMENYYAEGKLRAMGLSCYYKEDLLPFLPQISVRPVLIQNELHPYNQDTDEVNYIKSQNIAVMAWYPLGGREHVKSELMKDPLIARIAEAHHCSLIKVILRWHYQRGVITVPGSSNPAHIAENMNIFDFSLTEDEMKQISAIDRNEKFEWF